jgi:hypothetical protein
MRPVSDAFLAAVRGSHAMSARARVVAPGLTGTNPTGTVVPILAGDVRLDATADVRSTLDMSTDGTGAWPDASTDLLAPYGNELFVERGVQFGGGTTEWVSLGYFRIQSVEQDRPPDGPIRVTAQDRMAGIVEARLTSPRQYTASTSFGAIVDDLVLEVYPSATIDWDDATDLSTTGRALLGEEDRYALLKDLVTSVGKVAYWDHRGHLVIRTPPDTTDPVVEVGVGRDGVLVSMTRQLSREGVYNAVVATGEAADTDAPPRAVVVDANPLSPTYWYGGFGKVPRFYSSPFITTVTQATTAAGSLLRQSLGLPYSVDFTAVPNPALEPLDPVRISYPGKDGSRTHVIETLTVPLVASGALAATTREQTVVLLAVAG